MMSQPQALMLADQLRVTSGAMRRHYDAIWALAMAYAQGVQWGNLRSAAGGRSQIHRLPPILKSNRTDVRVTMDLTESLVKRTVANSKPTRIPAIIIPEQRGVEGLVVKDVYGGVLEKIVTKTGALKVWRSIHLPRAVLGDGIVRRMMSATGRSKKLKQESKVRKGQPLELRNIDVGLARVNPFEIIRDPAANTVDPSANESCFGHEKPRTVEWVKKNFHVEIETDTTFGSLTNYQEAIMSATGWGASRHVGDSKTKAVLVYEFFFQDGDEERDWPWHLIAYYDPTDNDARELRPLHFGPNPFFGLPFHFIHYSPPVVGPWAKGIPMTLKGAQDVQNLSWTAMVRVLIDMYPKWRIQRGTVEDPDRISNAVDKPILWEKHKDSDQAPDRIPAPSANPIATEIAGAIKEHARSQVSISSIQEGESVKRGQSARAYETVLESAESVSADMQFDDQTTLTEMLFGLTVDTGKMLRLRRDTARKFLGPRYADEAIRKALSKPPEEQIAEVKLLPNSQRNRTPAQIRDEFTEAVKSGVLEPLQGRREMLAQGNIVTDQSMDAAMRKQELEIQLMIDGEPQDVSVGEDHETAIWVLEVFQSGEQWMNLPPDQQQSIEDHWAAHMNAQRDKELFIQSSAPDQSGQSPAVGTPPGDATTNLGQVEPVGSLT